MVLDTDSFILPYLLGHRHLVQLSLAVLETLRTPRGTHVVYLKPCALTACARIRINLFRMNREVS
jgi:hypothetical protein